jgi:cation transport ATPase
VKKVMGLSAIVFFGWYHILDKSIYSFGANREGIGPKEHSFFITFLFHGINLWTLLSYLLAKYLSVNTPLYVGLVLGLAVFASGYVSFFRKRASEILTRNVKNMKTILFVAIALAYVILSIYLMFKAGDYVREIVLSQK